MKNLKKIISVTAAAAMVMSTVAPVSVFADDATFKIGGIGPVTGAAAIYGQAVKNATELAINEVNEDGAKKGKANSKTHKAPFQPKTFLQKPSQKGKRCAR